MKKKIEEISKEDIEKSIEKKKASVIKRVAEEDEVIENPNFIYGWQNPDCVAYDIYSSVMSQLLRGQLIFAFCSNTPSSDIQRLVVVLNPPMPEIQEDTYGVGMVTAGYSMVLPMVPKSYLETTLSDDLKKYNVPKEVQKNYRAVLKKLS